MIHAVCDFCGKDVGRSAMLLSITPFQNFARTHTDTRPYGYEGKTRSFVMCSACRKKHELPNPYHDYKQIQDQECGYPKCLDNYTEDDKKADVDLKTRAEAARNEPAIEMTALFTGEDGILTALNDRAYHVEELVRQCVTENLSLGKRHVQWLPGIFLPEAGVYGFNVTCADNAMLSNAISCEWSGVLPKGTQKALRLMLHGTRTDIVGLCQKICDMSGLSCHLVYEPDEDDGLTSASALQPKAAPMTVKAFVATLRVVRTA